MRMSKIVQDVILKKVKKSGETLIKRESDKLLSCLKESIKSQENDKEEKGLSECIGIEKEGKGLRVGLVKAVCNGSDANFLLARMEYGNSERPMAKPIYYGLKSYERNL